MNFHELHERVRIPCRHEPHKDESLLLNLVEHRFFQRVIGLATWAVTACRPDLARPTTYLNKYCAATRRGPLEESIRMMDYFGTRGNEGLFTDLSDHPIPATAKRYGAKTADLGLSV